MNNPVYKDMKKKLLLSSGSWFLFNYFLLWDKNWTDLTDKIKDSLLFGISIASSPLLVDKLEINKTGNYNKNDIIDYFYGLIIYLTTQYYFKTNTRDLEDNIKYATANTVLNYYLNKNALLNIFGY